MKKKKCLVVIPMNEAQRERLIKAAQNWDVQFTTVSDVTMEEIKTAEIIMGNVPPKMISQAENLKWLQTNSAGVNQYTPEGILKEGTLLSSSVGAYNISVTEGMVASTMDLYRLMPAYMECQKKHEWKDLGPIASPYGATVLVVGAGEIGHRYAKIMKALGSHTIGIKKDITKKPEEIDEVYSMSELHNCLKEADVVMSVLPATKATEHIFGKEEFDLMKSSAYFLNFGRGNSVITDDLCDALESGAIAGAALDVTDPEPLPADHRLWDAPNLILTPHVSGAYHIPVTLDNITEICVENLKHYEAFEPLRNQVDFKKGY